MATQTIAFPSGGTIDITGGSVGTGNSAGIYAANGAQAAADLIARLAGKLKEVPEGGGAATAIDLAIASHGLSHEFPPAAIAEAHGYGEVVPAAARAGRASSQRLHAAGESTPRSYR